MVVSRYPQPRIGEGQRRLSQQTHQHHEKEREAERPPIDEGLGSPKQAAGWDERRHDKVGEVPREACRRR